MAEYSRKQEALDDQEHPVPGRLAISVFKPSTGHSEFASISSGDLAEAFGAIQANPADSFRSSAGINSTGMNAALDFAIRNDGVQAGQQRSEPLRSAADRLHPIRGRGRRGGYRGSTDRLSFTLSTIRRKEIIDRLTRSRQRT